ncbi:MAG: hypothetical protein ABEH40_08260 [Haloferacaceae archaeon]
MSLYAVDAIDDAIDATRAFLWPFDRGRWARLALVVFFVGGSGSLPLRFPGSASGGPAPGSDPGPGPGPAPPDALPSLGGPELAAIVGVAAILGLLALGFAAVGSVMEFVFVESLRRESVALRRYWRDRWRQGLRLFGFRAVLGILTVAAIGLLLIVAVGPLLLGEGGLSLGVLAVAVPVGIAVAAASGLVGGFTTAFVVPIMIVEDRGLLSAWRRFWPTLTGQWKQYAAYAVLGWILQLVGGIVAGLATLLAALVVAIPLGLLGLLGAGVLAAAGPVGWVLVGLAAVLFVLALVAIGLLVGVPVRTFLRYYALFVLGDTNDAFDAIADRRRAVRE